jgi:cbb3-type cytochrome oxidase subunit 3
MRIGTMKIFLFLILIVASFFSCNRKKFTKQSLNSYINHSAALNKEQEINGIKVRLKYIPHQLLVWQELGNAQTMDSSKINEIQKKYSGRYYFRLSYSKNNKEVIRQLGSYDRYSDLLQVMSFEMGKYITLYTDKRDTLPLGDFIFDQEYGMTNANNLLLAFNQEKSKSSNTIDIDVSEFGLGIGNTRFEFNKRDIDEVETLCGL